MLTTVMVSLTFLLVCGLFVYSKQGMLRKLFTNQMFQPASELQNQFEMTADRVILNLESHITHLEDLLEQADERIEILDSKLLKVDQEQILNLESHITHLEDLLEQADERIEILDGKLPKIEKKQLDRQEIESSVSMPTKQSAHLPYGITQYNRQNNSWLDTTENSNQITNLPDQEGVGSSMNQQRSVIMAMFKQGYKDKEIAKATGLGQGEIALFLQLHNKN
jgi:hypothetical protein